MDFDERLSKLPPEKKALLEKRLHAVREQSRPLQVTRSPQSGETFLLSFAQERIWFLHQLVPTSPVYNRPLALKLKGALDLSALIQALNGVMCRHAVLRGTFPNLEGQPIFKQCPPAPVALNLVDLSGLLPQEFDHRLEQLIVEEARRPFDLEQGPLARFSLFRLRKDEYILLLVFHHIVFDAWSVEVFQKEFIILYEAHKSQEVSPLPELPIQYWDYVYWQREWLKDCLLQKQLEYWKKKLEGLPPPLNLPTDRPRPSVQTFNGQSYPFWIYPDLGEKLNALARQEGATLYMVLLSALLTLLHRYTGESDIALGTLVANRTHLEVESLIGLFVNTLVIRGDLSGNPTFRELLRRVRETALEAYDNKDLPFEKLVGEISHERDLSRTPLFQVVLNMKSIPEQSSGSSSLQIEPWEFDDRNAPFDLTLEIKVKENTLACKFIYNTDLFNLSTIRRLSDHFLVLLNSIVTNPEQTVGEMPMLTVSEREQILFTWNDTQRDFPQTACVHQIFEQQVVKSPEALAVVYDQARLTYHQLNVQANQVAHRLRNLGIGPGVLVGVCLKRSPEMISTILAILKAGGAYFPLDPSYPKARLSFMMRDTQSPVLISHSQLEQKIPTGNFQTLLIDLDEGVHRQSTENLSPSNTASDLAYVIYTSGSTGKPKGICIPHRAINRLVCNSNYITIMPGDRIAQASNASFDALTFEVWGALLNGGCLIGVPQETLFSPARLKNFLRQQGIQVLFLTTALFNQIVAEEPDAFKSLRELLFGGEKVTPAFVRKVLEVGPPQRVLHVYGPTENTTFTTWYQVTSVPEDAHTIPIGKPIANTQCYILDQFLNPVPKGVISELYIGGDGLAIGYLNQPEQTEKSFILCPISGMERRLYRTGDQVRYLEDGSIEFIGRVDDQVKIRGFRVELGEIEWELNKLPSVSQAVVHPWPDQTGTLRLVAYIVPNKPISSTPEQICEQLQTNLPDFMIPSVSIFLDELPLTPNGKVDRNALPKPASLPPIISETSTPPHSELEKQLARIWAEVLEVETVGLNDNFFKLGGHSLLAMRLVFRVSDAFGVELPVRSLFEAPTISGMIKKLVEVSGNLGRLEKIAEILSKLSQMSEEEAYNMLLQVRQNNRLRNDR